MVGPLFAIISTAASEWIKGLLLIIFPQQMVVKES